MSQINGISGFDPLAERLDGGTAERSIFEDATRRIVENILKSYTGYYDLFSEVLQNALDAVEAKRRNSGSSYKPRIHITIDIQNKIVRVIDNGCGMDLPQFKFCFSPSVSFKSRREYRGHKGVGATFLAYGFSLITLQTKQLDFRCAARLRQGRQWAEDLSESVQRPVFEERPFDVPELDGESSGTAVEILIAEGQRPNLGYYGATTADQWIEMLRIRTPLGGVYLTKPPFTAQVFLRVIDSTGQRTEIDQENITYLFPHELPVINKVKDITEIDDVVNSVSGDPQTKMERLPNAFKRLDAIYEIWSKDMLLAEGSQFSSAIDEGQRALIERHKIIVYGCFMSTAKTWTQYNDEHLHLRRGSNIIRGGLQLASDGMVQGDLRTIPLTSTVGYQANAHIIVHFADGNPDMGRKVFQPELTELADELSRRAVGIFRRYLTLMRPDTGVAVVPATRELFNWKVQQLRFRDENPLSLKADGRSVAVISRPQQEQDVIALFHEFLGSGFLRGLRILATSPHQRYDSLYVRHYPSLPEYGYRSEQPLGVAHDLVGEESEPLVLEYKYDLDSLMADFDTDTKFPSDIDFVVCWQTGTRYKEKYFMNSLLVGDEGSVRRTFGATHDIYLQHHKLFEVLILSDLCNFILSPEDEIARQKVVYRG